MKEHIFEICKNLNIEVIEREISLKEIENFDFVFISNSLMKVMNSYRNNMEHFH